MSSYQFMFAMFGLLIVLSTLAGLWNKALGIRKAEGYSKNAEKPAYLDQMHKNDDEISKINMKKYKQKEETIKSGIRNKKRSGRNDDVIL